jgi:putative oxidoreductase
MNALRPYAPYLLSLARFVVGLLLLAHGTAKLLGFPASPMAGVPLGSLFGISGVFELIGGALLVVGLLTRPTAFILSGMAAVAYFYVHFPKSFFPMLNGGEAAILFCFSLLYLAAAGGGPWSVDHRFKLSNGEEASGR